MHVGSLTARWSATLTLHRAFQRLLKPDFYDPTVFRGAKCGKEQKIPSQPISLMVEGFILPRIVSSQSAVFHLSL